MNWYSLAIWTRFYNPVGAWHTEERVKAASRRQAIAYFRSLYPWMTETVPWRVTLG